MITTSHALTGAVIGLSVKQPALALPLAFASHFALDALPHFGIPGAKNFLEALKDGKLSWLVAIADPLMVLILFLVLFINSVDLYVYLAALLAISPDFEWFFSFFIYELRGKKAPRSPLADFHGKIQKAEFRRGILIEAVWISIGWIILFKLLP